MKEIRRRTRVVGAFPDGNSCLNLAAASTRSGATQDEIQPPLTLPKLSFRVDYFLPLCVFFLYEVIHSGLMTGRQPPRAKGTLCVETHGSKG